MKRSPFLKSLMVLILFLVTLLTSFTAQIEKRIALSGRLDGKVSAYSSLTSLAVQCGDASFVVAPTFGAGTQPFSVAIGDFNGDGKQDLAVANNPALGINNSGTYNVSILLGDGLG